MQAPLILLSALLPVAAALAVANATRIVAPGRVFAAGRDGSALAVGLGEGASALPACLLFTLAGFQFAAGFDGLSYGLGLTAGLVLAAVLIAPPFRASGALTVAGFMGDRFGAPARLLSLIVVVLSAGSLLVAELTFAGDLARRFLGIPATPGIVLLLLGALGCALPGGVRGASRAQIPLSLVLAVGFLVPLALLGAQSYGWGYGAALPEIARLETAIIEAGRADLASFRPHTSPFLDIDAGNFAAIVICLAAGTPALAHIVGRFATLRSGRDARLAGAWTALFAALLLATVPAYAALVKLEVYAPIAVGRSFSDLPPWLETLSRLDVVRIHGTSAAILDDVARAAHGGAADIKAVASRLTAQRRRTAEAWVHLKVPVREAILAAARTAPDGEAARWDFYRTTVLPAAATAAGNATGLLTQGGLAIDAVGVMAAVPAMTGAPLLAGALLLAAAVAALLATTTALMTALGTTLVRDAFAPLRPAAATAEDSVRWDRAAFALVAVVAAVASIALRPAEPAALALAAFSIAASGLFPAFVLGLWWRRASAWGATAAILVGLAVCLTYEVGTRYFPVAFYSTWSGLSDAGPDAVRKFHRLEAAVESAPAGTPKAAARSALAAHAAGTSAMRAGVANWFGVYSASAAVFALPVGLFVMLLAGLVTPRQGARRARPNGP